MDETTDAKLRSWVDVSTDSHFPIQNLPYGVAIRNSDHKPILVTAIGDCVLVDTFHPLLVAKSALDIEDPNYSKSWLEGNFDNTLGE